MTMTLEELRESLDVGCLPNTDRPRWFAAIDAAIRERADLWSKWQAERCFRAKAETELVALKARIAKAPVVACPKTLVHAGNTMQTEFLEYTHERMPGGCNSWAGKHVRLIVEE